ncbi:MAG: hypothetical protein JNL79_25275 [Myxococcales bacterium]|nr:hypothetical protein [Myxococcales bacterium]
MLSLTSAAAIAAPQKSWLASEQPLVAPRKGVVVVAMGSTPTDATWPIALAVYGVAGLRPTLTDRGARVLAGEPVLEGDPEPVKDLAALRAKVENDDAPSRAMLSEIARRTRCAALVVVTRSDAVVEARVFDAKEDRLEATRHRAETKGAPWQPLTAVLETRYAPPPPVVKKEEPKPMPVAPTPEAKPFYKSPWFWGALGTAAAAGVGAWLLTRNQGDSAGTAHVEWATK